MRLASFVIAGYATICSLQAALVTFSAVGDSTTASIQSTVDSFRGALGTNNGTGPGPFATGRREVNWDAVPAGFQAPTVFPGDFFNQPTAGRARGLQMSAAEPFFVDPGFGNFPAFSPNLIFGLSGTVLDITFSVPGFPGTTASTSGFGAIFTDVDRGLDTEVLMEFFDPAGDLLGSASLTGSSSNAAGFAFLGGLFNAGEQVGRVRISAGSGGIFGTDGSAGGDCGTNCIGMDDFIYGEPQQVVPEPSSIVLLTCGVAALAIRRRLAS